MFTKTKTNAIRQGDVQKHNKPEMTAEAGIPEASSLFTPKETNIKSQLGFNSDLSQCVTSQNLEGV